MHERVKRITGRIDGQETTWNGLGQQVVPLACTSCPVDARAGFPTRRLDGAVRSTHTYRPVNTRKNPSLHFGGESVQGWWKSWSNAHHGATKLIESVHRNTKRSDVCERQILPPAFWLGSFKMDDTVQKVPLPCMHFLFQSEIILFCGDVCQHKPCFDVFSDPVT